MSLEAGKYTAKAKGIRFVQNKLKTKTAIEVAFTVNRGETQPPALINWVGWITPDLEKGTNPLERTMKTLVEILDYNGDDTVEMVAPDHPRSGMLKNQDAINRQKEVELVIDMEFYTTNDESGNPVERSKPRIKWVNNLGGGQFAGATAATLKNDLASAGFKAAFLQAKGSKGAPPVAQQRPPQSMPMQQQNFNENDIPF